MFPSSQPSLHKIWWLWFPIAFLLFDVVVENVLPHELVVWFISEQGPVEMGQSLIMFIGFIVAVRILCKLNPKTQCWLAVWVGVAALACFYVTVEELSWGQQLLHWNTPAEWAALNDQNETNFHNTSSWLDQKPRLVLEIGVLIGGLIIPLLMRFKPSAVPGRFATIYPTPQLFPTALMAVSVKIIDEIDQSLQGVVLFERGSEVYETYLFIFVLLYLLMLRRRVMQHQG